MFDERRFAELRDARGARLGRPTLAVAETGSTNDDALAAARSGAPAGALFVADLQTRGRGRRGHQWTSPAGENLTFSLVLRPRLPPDRASSLTLVAGLAVRSAAQRRVEQPLTVKWPNDVLAGNAKVAGILVETQVTGSELGALIVGVGINVAMRTVPEAIASIATSLALLGATDLDRESLLADILVELDGRLEVFERAGLVPAVEELRSCDALRGRRLAIDGLRGVGAGIDGSGALCIRTESGDIVAVTSGTVTFDD